MTKEELIKNLKYTMEKHKNDTVDTFGTNISLMCKDILNYLEQEPCEDAISRQAVLDATVKKNSVWNAITNASGENLEEIINSLPSVTPTREHGEWTDEVIEKQGNKLIECMTTEACKIARGNIDMARKILAGKISEEEEKQLIFGADMRKVKNNV